MERYIDADALLSKLPDDLPYKASVKRVLMQAPTAHVEPKSEVDKWQGRCREWHEVAELKSNYIMELDEGLAKANAEIERLHGILLQFTDIVHKWGARNGIDTSEISLVPILQEEAVLLAESKSEVAIEIIQDIAKACAPHDHHLNSLDFEIGYITAMNKVLAQLEEIKKKYTKGE
jgi:hypothetical protein